MIEETESRTRGATILTEAEAPERIGLMLIDELLNRDGFMLYDTSAVRALHYAEAGAAFGAVRLARRLGERDRLNRLAKRYDQSGLPVNTANHVDANACGILPLSLFLALGDQAALAEGLALADGQWAETRPDGLSSQTRFWIDDVWMIGCLQTQAYRATKDIKYLDRAALTIEAYLTRLRLPDSLFFHGEEAPFRWGRGNGWVAAGLAELLSELPASHPKAPRLRSNFLEMAKALINYQTKDGLWRQLLDYENAWIEASASALFGYALALGVKTGALPKAPFSAAYMKAWKALITLIDGEGRLGEVCAGTWQSADAAFYLNRPRVRGDFHGQAPLLWFAWSLLP